MNEIFNAYQRSQNKNTFFNSGNDEINFIIERVKQHYRSLDGYLETDIEILERDHQIEDITDFVVNYMKGQKEAVPKGLYRRHQFSLKETFYGTKKSPSPSKGDRPQPHQPK